MNERTAARIRLARMCEAHASVWTVGGTASIHGVGTVSVFRRALVWHWIYSAVIPAPAGSASGWAFTHRGAWLAAREAVLRSNP